MKIGSQWRTQLQSIEQRRQQQRLLQLVAWRSGNAFHSINEVTLRRAGLVLGWVCLMAGKPSRYVTSRLSQLSLPSLRGK